MAGGVSWLLLVAVGIMVATVADIVYTKYCSLVAKLLQTIYKQVKIMVMKYICWMECACQ